MPGILRERLQMRVEDSSFAISSMNDFPIPEDPPIITTAVYSLRASLSEEDKRKEEVRLFSVSQPNNIGSYE
jgi:hypothetical protein